MRPRFSRAARLAGLVPALAAGALLAACGSTAQSGLTTASLPSEPAARPMQPSSLAHAQAVAPSTRPDYPTYSWNRAAERNAYVPPQATHRPASWYATPRPPERITYQPRPLATSRIVEVEAGDTLYGIARRNNVSVASLIETNQLNGIAIHPGQRLALPAGAR